MAEHITIATSFFQRAKGLLGCSKLKDTEGIYIPNCRSIHMFFMMFSIDAIFVDREMKITKIIQNLKPFMIGFGTLKSKGVIELSNGFLRTNSCNIGDKINFY